MAPQSICVGIIAFNEQHRIKACINSARFADQILVIDGGSQDDTASLAEASGAEVHKYHDWQGFAEQRNRLLAHNKCDYIFFLDCDEIITPQLAAEIRAVIQDGSVVLGVIQWLEIAYGKPLERMRPSKGVTRLFKSDILQSFKGYVHENPILSDHSSKPYLFSNKVPHYSRTSVVQSLNKLIQYVQHGAAKRRDLHKPGGIFLGLCTGLTRFFSIYIARKAFLCGGEGFLYSFFISLEIFLRYCATTYDDIAHDEVDSLSARNSLT